MGQIIIGVDLNGTLFDDLLVHFEVVNWLLKKYGFGPLSLEKLQYLFEDHRTFYRQLGCNVDLAELNKFYQPAFELLVSHYQPLLLESSRRVLMQLRGRKDVKLFLITYQKEAVIKIYDDYAHFLPIFHKVISTRDKLADLKRLKAQDGHKENIYFFISDTVGDILDAKEAGWHPVAMAQPRSYSAKLNLRQALYGCPRSFLIQHWLELKEVFQLKDFLIK